MTNELRSTRKFVTVSLTWPRNTILLRERQSLAGVWFQIQAAEEVFKILKGEWGIYAGRLGMAKVVGEVDTLVMIG